MKKKKFSINNMLVKTKITMFSGIMLAFMVIIAAVGLFASNEVNKQRQARYNDYAMAQYYLSEAFTEFGNMKARIRNMAIMYFAPGTDIEFQDQITKMNNYEKNMNEDLAKFEESLKVYNNSALEKEYSTMREALDKWVKNTYNCAALIATNSLGKVDYTNSNTSYYVRENVEKACDTLMGTGRDLANDAEAALQNVVDMVQDESDANGKKVNSELTALTAIMIVVAVIAVIVALVYAMIIIRAITVPIEKMSAAAKKLAVGDVDVDCEKIHDDDLGMLMDEFKEMVENIRGQAKIADTVANGDLTVKVSARGEKDLLGNALSKLVSENDQTLGNIKESTMQVTVGSEQVASASQSLAQGATEQASALQQVTASMNEIAERTKQNASQASQADDLARNAMTMAVSGNEQMKSLIGAMNDINESSDTISKVIKTIDDIAFQTNILALNAAVEAARAGVHGKGFAVVAEEVRNLAAKSAAAASETESMIEDSIHKVNNGTKIAEGTAQALDEIVQSIEKVGNLISAIATASNDQATAVSQVDQAIGQVSQVVQTNSATSEECAAASEELSNQAATLRSLVSNYKLTAGNGRSAAMSGNGGASFTSANSNEQIISLNGEFGKY